MALELVTFVERRFGITVEVEDLDGARPDFTELRFFAAPTDWDGAFTGDSAARGFPHMEDPLAAASAR